jgi:DNA-binding transcriptional MerR regulator
MNYAIADLVELTGVAPRTIRSYIVAGLVPRPEGAGLGAVYRDEHLVRLKTVTQMRRQGGSLEWIKGEIAGWSVARCKRWLAQNAPEPEPAGTAAQPATLAPPVASPQQAPPPPAAPSLGEPLEGEPVSQHHRLPGVTAATARPPAARGALPDVPRWRVLPLLPKLAIVVGDDASPVVQRIAEEIYETYGGG